MVDAVQEFLSSGGERRALFPQGGEDFLLHGSGIQEAAVAGVDDGLVGGALFREVGHLAEGDVSAKFSAEGLEDPQAADVAEKQDAVGATFVGEA